MNAILTAPQTQCRVQTATTPPPGWNQFLEPFGYDGFHLRGEWGTVFRDGLKHQPYFLWAEQAGSIVGVLPLMFINGPIFGRFLASQPYLNTGGLLTESPQAADKLIKSAVALAARLDVKHLELRQE